MIQDWGAWVKRNCHWFSHSYIHSLTCSSVSRVKTALRWDFPGDPVEDFALQGRTHRSNSWSRT